MAPGGGRTRTQPTGLTEASRPAGAVTPLCPGTLVTRHGLSVVFGKAPVLLRQLHLCGAAGRHPWKPGPFGGADLSVGAESPVPGRVSPRAGVTGGGDGRDTHETQKRATGPRARWPFPAAVGGVTTSWTLARCPVWLSEVRRRETGTGGPREERAGRLPKAALPAQAQGGRAAADSEKPELRRPSSPPTGRLATTGPFA